MLKSDLHSTLPLCAPTFVASLVQSHYWTVVLQLTVDSMLLTVVEVVVEVAVELYVLSCVTEGDFAGCAGRVTEVSIGGGGCAAGGCAGGGKGEQADGCATGGVRWWKSVNKQVVVVGGGKGEGGGGGGGAGVVKEVYCPGATGVGPSACNVLA